MHANIYLCGPPGAGKTTVAPLLARLRGMDAADVDATIEAEDGRTIARMVDDDGEPAFRARERATIAALAARGGTVVALGGGALEDPANREAIAASGATVFLDTSVATCEMRTRATAGTRPLLRDPDALARLHAARRPRYLDADVRIASDAVTPDDLARRIDAALRDERLVHVATAKPYDVAIGAGVLDALPQRAAPAPGGLALIVADDAVGALGRRIARGYEAAGIRTSLLVVHADEALKSFDAVGRLYAEFVARGLDRRSLVVGAGGGTIGDAVGFAAATYQRGVAYAGVPTTLLAAVDAAIGGKTAINLPSGKNLVGSVTQPVHVAIAPQALRSLPRRDVLSGYGEMLKYGLALDAELYRSLRESEAALLDDPAVALDAIARCVALKAEIVARDEEDRLGVRAVLNFGHTVGHALEKVAGYGTLRHGEAVIVGMRAALALSVGRAALPAAARSDADAHLASLPVPGAWRALDAAAVIAATSSDKKRHAGGTQYVLLDAIGTARLHDGVSADDVRAALAEIGLASAR